MSAIQITAADVRAALKRFYPQPTFGIVFEVAQATGFNARRHLDAVAMGLWPSRGLSIYGIEIKVNRYDWRKERDNPAKAEEIAKFCDYFYVAAPAGIVPLNEVPDAWGLLEYRESGLVEAKAPSKNKTPKEGGREFMAAIFRAASREVDPDTLDAMLAKREKELLKDFDARVQLEVERRTARLSEDGERWARLVAQIGVGDTWTIGDDLAKAVRAVHASGVTKTWEGLARVEGALADALAKIKPVMAQFQIENSRQIAVNRRRGKS